MSQPATGSLTPDGGVQVDTSPKPGEAAPQRPSWLPDKFKDGEALAQAYSALETELGKSKAPAAEAGKEVEKAGLDLDVLHKEYAENGKLSDETLALMESKGLSRDVVNTYIAGVEAIETQRTNTLAESVGGKEKLSAILEWAATGLDAQEAGAYNDALNSGNDAQAKLLLQAIAQKYTAANGSDPKLVKGTPVPSGSGPKPFKNADDVFEAMHDPRYRTNATYREEVERRLAVSNPY